ncbi:MAG: DUF3987 domain-containing protein [Gammaproteobacteria bacterium]|nr:DUF3987 domain-containing protein [Gammaproteobacteria bacterium]
MGKIEKIDQMESWPTLVRLDHPNLPKFDLSWLPNWAGDFAEALATHTETPTTLAGCLVLAACSTAAARRIEVMPFEGHTEPCNLWIVVALPPGSRKSSVHRAAVAPLVEWEKDQAFINEPEIKRLTSQRECSEARIKALRRKAANTKKIADSEEYANEAIDIEDNLPEIPVNPRLWTSDSTPEKLGNLLAENNGCLGWLSSEGGLFDMLNGRYSRGVPNLDLFLKAHSGDPERVDRGSREHVYIESARLSIGLSPQPDVLRGLANNPGFKGRGLLARFLYFMPVSTVGYRTLTPTPIPKAVQDKYDAGLRAMLDYSESTHYQLSLSQEAYAEWLAFSLTIERDMRAGGDLAEHTDWGGKAPGAAARVSGVLHAIKYAHTAPERHTIDQTTMMHAIAIIDIAKQHTLYALDLMSAEDDIDDARQAWLWISINALTEPITERDIFQGMRARFARMNKLQETLSILEERGYIKRSSSQSNKAGRPSSPIIQIRPNLCKENKNELE